jgi:hypothetical protein
MALFHRIGWPALLRLKAAGTILGRLLHLKLLVYLDMMCIIKINDNQVIAEFNLIVPANDKRYCSRNI